MKSRLINLYQRARILKYRFLSQCKNVQGTPTIYQPVQFMGQGTIKFHGRVNLGVYPSAYYFSGYIYIEARSPSSVIEIEDGAWINNNSFLVSDGPGIFIGKKTMLGTHCEVVDSDFHDTHPDRRMSGVPKTGRVVIGENVLIGSNVKILKGVRIGRNSIIANGSVVTRSFPENMVIFGNPAKGGFGLTPGE
jgi:maltose O-acetyltransferase